MAWGKQLVLVGRKAPFRDSSALACMDADIYCKHVYPMAWDKRLVLVCAYVPIIISRVLLTSPLSIFCMAYNPLTLS